MKHLTGKLISLALTGVLATGVLASCGGGEEKKSNAASMVSIDVNPSVSLVLDKNDKVISVMAENEDAQVMLYGQDFKGLTAEEATEKIAELAVKLGYLNEDNHGISVTSQGKVDTDKLKSSVESNFKSALEASGKNFNINVDTEGLFSMNREVAQVNADLNLNLTVGEYELILKAQAADGTLSIDAASKLDTDELLNIIYENKDKYLNYATEAYLEAKDKATSIYFEAKEKTIESLWVAPYINPLNILKYKPNYGAMYTVYSSASIALESGIKAVEAIEKAAQEIEVPEAVQDEIIKALEITEDKVAEFKEAIKEDGKVTVQSIEKYLDRLFKNMTPEEKAEAKAAYDNVINIMKGAVDEIDKITDGKIAVQMEGVLGNLNIEIDGSKIKEDLKVYVDEYKATINKVKKAMEGKEKLPAAKAALKEIISAKERVLDEIKNQLDKNDKALVEKAVKAAESTFKGFENTMNDAINRAEKEAKAYLEKLNTERTK